MYPKLGSFILFLALAGLFSPFAPVFAEETGPGDGRVPIEIELPEPFYGGTPLPFWDPNLEPEDYGSSTADGAGRHHPRFAGQACHQQLQ